MAGNPRIDDLRRRVHEDPASIAFAQLAEELRRAGELLDAVAICRSGLDRHPAYVSARITLGRALLDLGRLDESLNEFHAALDDAPNNLAALRGIADSHHRLGSLAEALRFYRAALAIAPNDPDLEKAVATLAHRFASQPAASDSSGASALEWVSPQNAERERAERTVVALEQWLAAIDGARSNRLS